jgi:hypothetical protein
MSRHLLQQTSDEARQRQCGKQADSDTQHSQTQALTNDHANDIPGLAPSAKRMPISRVRLLMVYRK